MIELSFKFNLSQKEICQVIGVNRNTYKDYEIGIFCLFFLRYACVKQLWLDNNKTQDEIAKYLGVE